MSFDNLLTVMIIISILSQSLSSRAMSFDANRVVKSDVEGVSIPFEQGDVFRPEEVDLKTVTILSQSLSSRAMSFDGKDSIKVSGI